MLPCESCDKEHDGSYGSGRFCCSQCARSFSTRGKRDLINAKVSETLQGRGAYVEFRKCETCGKEFRLNYRRKDQRFCSCSCRSQNPEYRKAISEARIDALRRGEDSSRAIRCSYQFQGEEILCDSKLEYVCLDWFEKNHEVKSIKRSNLVLSYTLNEIERKYLPDFEIETAEGTFLVECKMRVHKRKNEMWGAYNESSEPKREALDRYALQNRLHPLWFDGSLHRKFYNSLRREDF